MMIKNRCSYCRSINFRADRALAGKLICMDCGKPLNKQKFYSSGKNIKVINVYKFTFLFIMTFLIIILLF